MNWRQTGDIHLRFRLMGFHGAQEVFQSSCFILVPSKVRVRDDIHILQHEEPEQFVSRLPIQNEKSTVWRYPHRVILPAVYLCGWKADGAGCWFEELVHQEHRASGSLRSLSHLFARLEFNFDEALIHGVIVRLVISSNFLLCWCGFLTPI